VGCDQISKEYARHNYKGQGTIEVVGDIFIIHYAENDGAFLSLGSNLPQPYKSMILTIIPAIFLFGFTFFILFFNKELTMLQLVCLATIIGGGISNIFDRIIFGGYVTDFMNFGIGNLRTGILNFADISITFGAIFLIFVQYLKERKLKDKNK
jgi:signal peptidase II